jgi:nitroreductase
MLYTILDINRPGPDKPPWPSPATTNPLLQKPAGTHLSRRLQRWRVFMSLRLRRTRARPGWETFCWRWPTACIAAQNAVVAAESLGLGSCYIGDILKN